MATRKIIRIFLYFIVLLIIFNCSCSSKAIKLKEYYHSFNANYPDLFQQFYFVSNYKGELKDQTFVDSLICSSLFTIVEKYDKFSILVFKYTKLANASRLSRRPMLIEEGNWLTGDESARNDLIQRLEYWPRSGYHLFNHNLIFSCDTTHLSKSK